MLSSSDEEGFPDDVAAHYHFETILCEMLREGPHAIFQNVVACEVTFPF